MTQPAIHAHREPARARTGRARSGTHLTALLLVLSVSAGTAAAAETAAAPVASGETATVPATHGVPADAASSAANRAGRQHGALAAIDGRVRLMAAELALDAGQQVQLKSLLMTQRAEVAKVWSDASVPAAIRIGATQAITDKTAQRIRAMLSDPQREKYSKAHQRDVPVGASGLDVEHWMKAARGSTQNAASARPVAAMEK